MKSYRMSLHTIWQRESMKEREVINALSYLDHTSVCTQVHSLLRTVLNCYQFISFPSFVLFCFLQENDIPAQQCERSVSFDCHSSSQIFWLFFWYVLKKCQCLAFQVLNYSITVVLICYCVGALIQQTIYMWYKLHLWYFCFLSWDCSDIWKWLDLYILLSWSNQGQKIKITASAWKLHGEFMFMLSWFSHSSFQWSTEKNYLHFLVCFVLLVVLFWYLGWLLPLGKPLYM